MWKYVLIVSPLKIIPGLRKDLRAFSFFIPCKNLRSTLMEVLHALKGRIDSLFQKNNQDKGEFWFHFVKFKGKLNSGRERRVREREAEGGPQTTFSAASLLPPILKYFIVFLQTSQEFALGNMWPYDLLEMGCLFAFHAAGCLVYDQQQTRRDQQARNTILETFFLSTSGENALLRRCNDFNSISLKGHDWECFCLFQNDKITCIEKY